MNSALLREKDYRNKSFEIIPFDKEDRYKKSNYLISAKYSSSLLENQVMAIAMQHIAEVENGDIISIMTAAEIKRALGKNYGQVYKELKKVSMRLKKNFIMIEDPENNRFRVSNIITDCIYENGEFEIIYNRNLKSIIFDLKNYTMLSLSAMCAWKSNVTFRMYELLRSNCYYPRGHESKDNVFLKEYDLSELKTTLGAVDLTNEKVSAILDNTRHPNYESFLKEVEKIAAKDKSVKKPKWNRWVDFHKQVLIPTIDEINTTDMSDLRVTYEPVKKGKGGKVDSIRFTLQLVDPSKKKEEDVAEKNDDIIVEKIDTDDFLDEILELLPGLKIKEARTIAELADYDISVIEEKVQILNNSSEKIINPVGWMIKAIKEDFKPTKVPKKVLGNKNISEIDYDQLADDLIDG